MKITLLAALLTAFSIGTQAQELKRGGYPLEEITARYTEQGYQMYEDYDKFSDRTCYIIPTKSADMFFYIDPESGLVSSSYLWPAGEQELREYIEAYNTLYETLDESQWRIKSKSGATYIALREEEGEYFFEFIFTID